MSGEKEKTNWLWPKIVDIESARTAAKSGYWAAVIVASMTGVVATIALLSHKEVMTVNAGAYIDAGVFAIIAWRVKRYSKISAVVGTVLFLAEKIAMVISHGAAGLPVAFVLMLMFINGARGVFGYHRFSPTTPQDVEIDEHAQI